MSSKQREELVLAPDPEPVTDRASGIGSSEIAAVVGLDPYTSPFDLYLEKVGEAPPRVETEEMYWGKQFQRPIIKRYERETGQVLVEMFDEPIRHPRYGFLFASPDAINVATRRNVEAKMVFSPNVAEQWGEPGTDQIPERYVLQVTAQMSVLDFDVTDVAVVLPRRGFGIYQVDRDTELEARVIELAEEFWKKHVLAGIPPPVGATEKTERYIKYLFPKGLGQIRQADAEEVGLITALRKARTAAKLAVKHQETIENDLKLRIGEAAGIEFPGFRLTWKNAKDSSKVEWEQVARMCGIKAGLDKSEFELLALEHTTVKPGSRRFLPKWQGEEEE